MLPVQSIGPVSYLPTGVGVGVEVAVGVGAGVGMGAWTLALAHPAKTTRATRATRAAMNRTTRNRRAAWATPGARRGWGVPLALASAARCHRAAWTPSVEGQARCVHSVPFAVLRCTASASLGSGLPPTPPNSRMGQVRASERTPAPRRPRRNSGRPKGRKGGKGGKGRKGPNPAPGQNSAVRLLRRVGRKGVPQSPRERPP